MKLGEPVAKYRFSASFRDGIADWTFSLVTEAGQTHDVPIRDGDEIPLLLQMCRQDMTVFFDPKTLTFCTGWNTPGSD